MVNFDKKLKYFIPFFSVDSNHNPEIVVNDSNEVEQGNRKYF